MQKDIKKKMCIGFYYYIQQQRLFSAPSKLSEFLLNINDY